MTAGKGERVLVDGATGYLGSHLVHKLCLSGYDVRALVHPGARSVDIEFLKEQGAEVFTADLSVPTRSTAFQGCAFVVHLIGSVAPKKGERLEDLHTGQTRNLVAACKDADVKRIVMITSLGAKQDADNSYHATKWMAENEIRGSGLEYVILRPPLLLGRVVGNRDSKLVRRYREIILGKKVVPLINGGKNKIQPLFIGDLVQAICLSLAAQDKTVVNQTLEVGGPEVMSLRQFVEKFMDALGVHKSIIALHPALANVLAVLCESVQTVPTVNRDQVKLALGDNVCADNALLNVLKLDLTPVKSAFESYNTAEPEVAAVKL
ncbi:MAG: NAD(P)H-binding protein [Candidatus Melainabacteria bacterium]|nr:NAD(P)H-binding protein [Candidatus Melainabacteria bacterium]